MQKSSLSGRHLQQFVRRVFKHSGVQALLYKRWLLYRAAVWIVV
jgi:hypothetical protein